MPFIHGKDTFVSVNGVNLSAYSTKTTFKRTHDSHDVTTFTSGGAHIYQGGLSDGEAEIEGIYDSTATLGPRDALEPLIDGTTNVAFVRRPEGTGTGRPQDTVQVLVTDYEEESPVADMVTWTLTLQLSGPVTSIDQP
jgi:hypothetical protein